MGGRNRGEEVWVVGIVGEELWMGGIVGEESWVGRNRWGAIVGREQLMGRNRGEESCRGGIVWEPILLYTYKISVVPLNKLCF